MHFPGEKPSAMMDQPENEDAVDQNLDTRLCLNCGFPNRNSDARCMFCQAGLAEESGLVPWMRHNYYVLKWRWQLKQKRAGRKPADRLPFFKGVGYFLVGAVLSGAGLYLSSVALDTASFSKALIAILLLLYGGFILKNLFSKS